MLYTNIISKMCTKQITLAFVVAILNLHVIYCESAENEFPNIDYSYISNDVSEPDVDNKKITERLSELLENNLNSNVKEAIESAIHRQTSEILTMATKNNNEMQDLIEKTFARKLELQENNLNIMKEAIANLTNVVQTMSQTLTNHTAPQTNNKGNETTSVRRECECEADSSDSRLLHVTVPSSVRARTDVWKYQGTPDKDDLDMYMVNVTGCQYMAHGYGSWQSVSNSPARGTWRRRLAVRGEWYAWILVTWGAGHDYRFDIGMNSNTETRVYDASQGTYVLQRATPGVMSQEKYSQFLYLQLEDGVMSFGALGESTPWCRHDVTVSAGDDVRMEYNTGSLYGVKLLVCE